MGAFQNILDDWAQGERGKTLLLSTAPGLVVRWLNEAQLRYASTSEILTGVWEPTVTSGAVALPADFLREIKDRVKWDESTFLREIAYADAINIDFSGTNHYSIWQNTFYVWAAADGTPVIPYIKKPSLVLVADRGTASLEIPTEYQHNLITYLDAQYERRQNNFTAYRALMAIFEAEAIKNGIELRSRREPIPSMRGGFF